MKISFLEMGSKIGKYTYRLLHYLIEINDLDVCSPDEADIILLSIDDIIDFPFVRNARKKYRNKKIMAGGFETFQGEYLLKYCDALVVGEGFEFFEVLKTAKSFDDLLALPYVLTRDKNKVLPSIRIDSDILPIVRLTKFGYYYLAGRGCKGKCSFCCTGFAYPNWHNLDSNLMNAYYLVSRKSSRNKITFITNDSIGVGIPGVAQSVRVDTYLENPYKFKSKFLHFGIEGFSEQRRKFFFKPISDVKIFQLIEVLEKLRQEAEFFFILGFPGTYDEMMSFAEQVPISTETYPTIHIKLTQFNPCAHTPLWSYDLNQLEYLTDKQLQSFRNVLSSRNTRFRMFPVLSNTRALYRSIIRRASFDEINQIERDPKDKKDIYEYVNSVEKNHSHLLTYDGRLMPNSQIITPHREICQKMAKKLEQIPINYKCDLNT